MKLSGEQAKNEKGLSALAILVMACYFAVFAVINFKCFARFCEQDMYADTLVAMMMWEQKSLFPLGYVFGNQLYVVATPVLAALFYGLTGSPNTAMALATTAMSALIMLSFFWLLRPVVKRGLSLSCAALMLALSCFWPGRGRPLGISWRTRRCASCCSSFAAITPATSSPCLWCWGTIRAA